jgi:hypothetical protein
MATQPATPTSSAYTTPQAQTSGSIWKEASSHDGKRITTGVLLQVLTDGQGNILAAALRTVGVASIPGEDVPLQVSLFPSEA